MWPVAISFHVKNFSFIDEPVDNGVGNGVVGKDLVKLPERQIGRCNRTEICVVTRRDDLEEQVAGRGVQCHVSQFVNDEHLRFSVFVQLTFQIKSFLRVLKVVHHFSGRYK